jgi:cephalosporin-C deacetylase-like acetyl esterase
MKKLTLKFLLILIFPCSVFSQNLLDNQWQFSIGDNMAWKEPGFNSSGWVTIKSGIPWEEQGFKDYNGFAWYRKSILIPEELKKKAIEFGGLTLNLGTIDNADQTYLNGKLVGQTGGMPPNYENEKSVIRQWNIKVEDILWGKENMIAVRVYDKIEDGGLTGRKTFFKPNDVDSYFFITPQFPHADQVFLNGEKAAFGLVFDNKSNYKLISNIHYTIISDFGDTISVWNEPLSVDALHQNLAEIDKGNLKPGFYQLTIDIQGKMLNFSKIFMFGVSPEKISSPTDRASDFEAFWQRTKQELAAVDPQYKMIKQDSLSSETHDVYLVEMRSLGNVLIRGWYTRPKAPGKFPAILQMQGLSSYNKACLDPPENMAVFTLNIRGHGNSCDDVNPGFPGFLTWNLKDKEKYIYRGGYMDCVRAVDFLCSREEVDQRYIVVQGGSQGGALSFATAALDNRRIALCIPHIPFLSDFKDYFRLVGWPANEFIDFEKENQSFGWDGIYNTLSYFDIKNLAGMIRCPVFMAIGLKDDCCPPHINFAAYNQLTVPKIYSAFPESGHGLPPVYKKMVDEWRNKQLDILRKNN